MRVEKRELSKLIDQAAHALSYLSAERLSGDEDDEPSGDDKCPKLECGHCRHGYVKGSDGCSTCECIKGKNIEVL